MSQVYEYTVIASKMSSASTFAVVMRNNKQRRNLPYEPGQYAAISFMHNGRPTPVRCFSITSSPTEQGVLQFGLHVGGDFTKTAMKSLAPGSKVIVEGAYGGFVFNAERDHSTLMLAGGIGITPFISMLRYADRLKLNNDIMLLYSCHSQDDIPFLKEIEGLTRSNPHFKVMFVVGSGPVNLLQGQHVVSGHIDQALLDQVTSKDYTQRTYFLCGPAGFMKAMTTNLHASGVPPESIISEAFSQGQKSHKALRHNLPLQVYALTGLSLLLGSATILVRDSVAAAPNSTAESNSQNQS